jgi:SAM-dependent methyltransferase
VRHGTIRGLASDTKVDHKRYTTTRITTGWQTCDCDEGFRPGMVLDPFAGTGTTLAVAAAYGRAAIGFDINPEGLKMFERRQSEVNRELFGTRWHQLSLDDAG